MSHNFILTNSAWFILLLFPFQWHIRYWWVSCFHEPLQILHRYGPYWLLAAVWMYDVTELFSYCRFQHFPFSRLWWYLDTKSNEDQTKTRLLLKSSVLGKENIRAYEGAWIFRAYYWCRSYSHENIGYYYNLIKYGLEKNFVQFFFLYRKRSLLCTLRKKNIFREVKTDFTYSK